MKFSKLLLLVPLYISSTSFVGITNSIGETKFEVLKNIQKDFVGCRLSNPGFFDYNDSKMICYNIVDDNDEIKGSFGILPNEEIGFYQTGNIGYEKVFESFGQNEDFQVSYDSFYSLQSSPDYSKFVKGPSYLYEETKSGFHYEGHLKDMPDYYQDYPQYLPFNNGCAPTSSTMLIGFYDRYIGEFDNLISDGVMPLNHDDNKAYVTSKILDMANLMGTDMSGKNGTPFFNEVHAISALFRNRGYSSYSAKYAIKGTKKDYFDLAQGIINQTRNPFLISVNLGEGNNHSALGIGWQTIYTGEKLISVHRCWTDYRGMGSFNVDMINYLTYLCR